MLNRLTAHLGDDMLPESQCGFRKQRGTTDMVFTARQLQEKCQEQHRDLYSVFVDLTKAFDTVNRHGLWKVMAKYGCPKKFINLVKQLHDGMRARVQEGSELSGPFEVSNGVKQGCVLAPTLFSLMFSAMLEDAFRDINVGINIRYRLDGKLFNLRRLQAKSRVKTHIIRDLLFADDCSLNASSEADLQYCLDKFAEACSNFGLTINTEKTEVMYQPAPDKIFKEPTIKVYSEKLKVVNRFTYLGSTLSQNITVDDEVNTRISKASSTFGRLYTNVWHRSGISLKTRLKVYRAVVIPVLLYSCETWTVYKRHAKKLNHFHTTCLRKIMNIKWQDKIPDTAILDRAGIPSIYTILMQSQLRWAGHVVRMPDQRLPKILFYGEMQDGRRTQGGQKKRYKDTLKSSLKAFEISPDTWEECALDRNAWRASLRKGAAGYETSRRITAERKRQVRKSRESISSLGEYIPCPYCPRRFQARIGLISHLRTHQQNSNIK